MVEIRVFEWPENGGAMKQLAILYNALDAKLQENFFSPGSFELKISTAERYADQLQKYRLVRIAGRFWGLIYAVQYEGGAGEFLTVRGRDLKGLTADRLTVPTELVGVRGTAGYDAIIGPTETVLKHFAQNNFFPAGDPYRHIPGLVIAADQRRGTQDDRYMTRFEPLSDVLSLIGEDAGMGYDVIPTADGKQFIFDIIMGLDRTAAQRKRPPVIFDLSRQTASSMTYENTDQSMKNIFYTTRSGAEFADEALTMTYTRDDAVIPAGIYRRETHLSLSADTPTAGQEYAELKRLALIEAGNYVTAEHFTAQILSTKYRYGKDFNLGDKVTVQNRDWGVSMDALVTAMEISIGSGGETYTATFGKEQLLITDRLKRMIRNRG